EERRTDPRLPEVGPWTEPAGILRPILRHRANRGQRRVAERSDHPGNIAEGRTLRPSLVQRTCGLAFEIENHDVPLGHQNLTEVIVAVRPDPRGGSGEPVELVELL